MDFCKTINIVLEAWCVIHYSVRGASWKKLYMWKSTAYQRNQGKWCGGRIRSCFLIRLGFWFLCLRALIMEIVQNMERQEQKYRSHWAVPFYNHFISNNSGLCSFQCSVIWMLQGIAILFMGLVETYFT